EPGDEVFRTNGAAQPSRGLDEDAVAAGVAESTVDFLETVEVDVDETEAAVAASRSRDRFAEPQLKLHAIGDTRERVVICEVRDLAILLGHEQDTTDVVGEEFDIGPVFVVE